ncbi:anthranilate synthase family protein [Actinomadura macrotermitis]|uniref:anthranilate synthase n=1 Tax=Actinomadura macrotermitis TaxID=2585200 RepID=A0A7K0C043_9ACTN|nr:anthranilate synthase family protein [Actinomadura macrotermitis]MQY06452.1 Isochorismate synthase MenF [Actinomadura macrotermitis]
MSTARAGDRAAAARLLERITGPCPPPFAVLHRPERTGPGTVEVLVGTVGRPETLAEVPVPEAGGRVLVALPYRQLTEGGLACVDDGAPLIAMTVAEHAELPAAELAAWIGERPAELAGAGFDVGDAEYGRRVQEVVDEAIGRGEGANFVMMRSFHATVRDFTPAWALGVFRRLLERETGAYWTFAVHTGDRTFVGASPERHVTVDDGLAVMNPISGTYRYPDDGVRLGGLLDFLADRKETDELYMVVDEELKMMARICHDGLRVRGPYLKEMARLAHTEYFIEGRTRLDVRDVLRETMFAPTVTGSPLESACRVIRRYEDTGRGYYSGALALIGRDPGGGVTLDSAILIRTAEIDPGGHMRIGVGATLVRHSDPAAEVAETHAKAAGLLAAMDAPGGRFRHHPDVRARLAARNTPLAGFWLGQDACDGARGLAGRKVLVVDAEDTFTAMMRHQLCALGLTVTVRRFDEPYDPAGHDLVILGPGPGDPAGDDDPRIARLRGTVRGLLAGRRPFLAVCLSHQVLGRELGLPIARRAAPNQGAQRTVDLFGEPELVGFYNSFALRADDDRLDVPGVGTVEVARAPESGEVDALRGPGFFSVQFHPESILTKRGPQIICRALQEVLDQCDSTSPGGTSPEPAVSRAT